MTGAVLIVDDDEALSENLAEIRIVADHGGVLQVESRPGKTCFTIALTVTERT